MTYKESSLLRRISLSTSFVCTLKRCSLLWSKLHHRTRHWFCITWEYGFFLGLQCFVGRIQNLSMWISLLPKQNTTPLNYIVAKVLLGSTKCQSRGCTMHDKILVSSWIVDVLWSKAPLCPCETKCMFFFHLILSMSSEKLHFKDCILRKRVQRWQSIDLCCKLRNFQSFFP